MVNFTTKDLIKFDYINWDKLNIVMIRNKKNIWKYLETTPNNREKNSKNIIVRVNDTRIYHLMQSNEIEYIKI